MAITDGHHTATGTTTVSGGTWTVTGINASSLIEGAVTYTVTETDGVSNTTTATQSALKDLANIALKPALWLPTRLGPGINNNVSVSISGNNFVFNDTAEAMYTNIPGATGSGTNTVYIPIGP